MNNFRIVQTQTLTQVLPYEIEEYRRVWFLPWPVWRKLKDLTLTRGFGCTVAMRFQTPREARLHIEHLQVIRAQQQVEQIKFEDERCQRQHLPRVVEVLKVPVLG